MDFTIREFLERAVDTNERVEIYDKATEERAILTIDMLFAVHAKEDGGSNGDDSVLDSIVYAWDYNKEAGCIRLYYDSGDGQ